MTTSTLVRTGRSIAHLLGILILVAGALVWLAASAEWFEKHPEYGAVALIVLTYLGLLVLGLTVLYIVIRVIRAAWHG